MTFALWGARRPEQLDAISEIAGWKLDASAMREIDRIVVSCVKQPVGPEFMAPPDRLAA
jgi:aryl-alcohol dehydrogenase-like predicted oxidoreductase